MAVYDEFGCMWFGEYGCSSFCSEKDCLAVENCMKESLVNRDEENIDFKEV